MPFFTLRFYCIVLLLDLGVRVSMHCVPCDSYLEDKCALEVIFCIQASDIYARSYKDMFRRYSKVILRV